MKKIYKIISLLIIFILLTSYNPDNLNLLSEKKYSFFKIKNIHITNTNIVEKSEIIKELNNIYNKNILFIGKRTLENPLLKSSKVFFNSSIIFFHIQLFRVLTQDHYILFWQFFRSLIHVQNQV